MNTDRQCFTQVKNIKTQVQIIQCMIMFKFNFTRKEGKIDIDRFFKTVMAKVRTGDQIIT